MNRTMHLVLLFLDGCLEGALIALLAIFIGLWWTQRRKEKP